MCISRLAMLICLLVISSSTGDEKKNKERLENEGKELSGDDSSSEASTEENIDVLNENKFDNQENKNDDKDMQDKIDHDKDFITSVRIPNLEEKRISGENSKSDEIELKLPAKQRELLVTDDDLDQAHSDDDGNDNVDITEAEIMGIIDDVDLFVGGKSAEKGESAVKNVILSDVDSKDLPKTVLGNKLSQNSDEKNHLDKEDTLDNTNNENNDETDILSLLETLSIDNNSEIKLIDDEEVDDAKISSPATGNNRQMTSKNHNNIKETIKIKPTGSSERVPETSLTDKTEISDVIKQNIDDLTETNDRSEKFKEFDNDGKMQISITLGDKFYDKSLKDFRKAGNIKEATIVSDTKAKYHPSSEESNDRDDVKTDENIGFSNRKNAVVEQGNMLEARHEDATNSKSEKEHGIEVVQIGSNEETQSQESKSGVEKNVIKPETGIKESKSIQKKELDNGLVLQEKTEAKTSSTKSVLFEEEQQESDISKQHSERPTKPVLTSEIRIPESVEVVSEFTDTKTGLETTERDHLDEDNVKDSEEEKDLKIIENIELENTYIRGDSKHGNGLKSENKPESNEDIIDTEKDVPVIELQKSGNDQHVSDDHIAISTKVDQPVEFYDKDKSSTSWTRDKIKPPELQKTSSSLYTEEPEDLNEQSKSEISRFSETNFNMHRPSVEGRNNQFEPNVVDMSMKKTLQTRRLLAQLDGEQGDDSEGGEASDIFQEGQAFLIPELNSNGTGTFELTTTIPSSNTKSSSIEQITTEAHTSVTKPPPTPSPTPQPLYCLSSPCFDGTCIEETNGYICVCFQGYTGTNCDIPIGPTDPCTQTPCPNGASCLHDGINRICVCPDGLKGPNCDEDDVHVVCQNLTVKINLHDTLEVNCTERINSNPNSLCFDPDDSLDYTITNSTGGALYGYESGNGTLACLAANSLFVVKPVYCTTVIATESDDTIYRPWRRSTSRVCVTFNEPPTFLPHKPVTINVRNSAVGDIVTTVNVVDSFVFEGSVYTIEDVQPIEYQSHFSIISDLGVIVFASIPATVPIPSGGQNVSIQIKVDDGGIPPLEANNTINITLVDINLQCYFPEDIYLGISSNKSVLEDNIVCTGATNLVYSVVQSSGLPMMIGANGTIIVMRSPKIELSPGDYNISVRVSSTNLAYVFVNFTLHVGYFEPSCYGIAQSLYIHKSTPPDTCFTTWYCNETISGYLRCDDKLFGGLENHLSIYCNVTGSSVLVKVCVNNSLQDIKATRVYAGNLTIRNDYGPRQVYTNVEIYNAPPIFVNSGEVSYIYENASIGDVVMTVLVQDDFGSPTLELIAGNDWPFSINSTNGEITVTRTLDYEKKQLYVLNIKATDSEGLTAFGFPNVTVEDVNEEPTCYHFNGTYIIRRNASTPINTQIGTLNCTDPDNNDRVRYQIYPKSSQEILDLFDINNKTGVIVMINQPGQSLYNFRVVVTDKAGLTMDINVRVFLNFYPPSCSNSKITVQVMEDNSSCIPVITSCTDPQGGSLNFTKDAAASGEPFEINTGSNNGFILCPVSSLVGMVGNRQFTVYAVNDIGQIPLQLKITIQDRNSAPYFVNLRNFTVSEKAPQGYLIGELKAEDDDVEVIFTTLSYSIDEVQSNFTIDGKSGVIRLGLKPLNATVLSEYFLQVKVADGGGLFDTETVHIIVLDINEPPTCQNPLDLVQGTISLTTPVETLVTSLVCWDHDKEDKYKTLVYNITGDNEGIFSVNGNGEITVAKPIPRSSKSFRFQVIVADLVMVESGNLTQRTTLDIRVAVDNNFPPVCNKTNSQLIIPETKIVGDCIEEILCEDVTLGNITVISVTGTGSSYFEVKSRALDSQGQLPLNLCIQKNIKNKLGGYTLTATVSNGLGTTSVRWDIEIIDVNEPPYFLNLPYNKSVAETQSVGSSVLQVEWLDPDFTADFQTVTINSIAKEPANATDYISFYSNTNTYVINKIQNAAVQNFFWFEVTARDKGGLSSTANVTIFITDINERPICPASSVTETIDLLTPVNNTIYKLGCYDTDREDNNRKLKYVLSLSTDIFGVTGAGEVKVISPLPRFQNRYTFNVVVSDAGVPSLSTTVNFVVNVNTAISADCSPTVDYPSIWVKDSCVKVNMSCTDPTMPDTTHLQYTPSGTYSTAFTLNTESQGVFQLCYDLLNDSNTKLTIIVSNSLLDYRYDLDLEVRYSASTPEFASPKYTASINENVGIGSSVVQLSATATGVGSIVYSILGPAHSSILQINASTGLITSLSSLKPYADQTITIQVQALNKVSQLKSSVDVEIKVIDINEAPVCVLGVPVVPVIKVDTPIDTVIRDITCTDPDITTENKDLTYSISGVPDAANVFKVINGQSKVSIATKTLLRVTVATYNVNVTVRDKGQPPKEVTMSFNVPVNLTPPVPSLEVSPVNMTTVTVRWLYQRVDFYTVTNQFVLTLNTGVLNLPVDKDKFLSYVIDLDPDTTYNVSLTAKTDYGDVVTPVVVVKTPAVPVLSTFVCSIKITDEDFDALLLDPQSFRYVTLTDRVMKSINFVLNRTPGFLSITVLMYRRGSVIVDHIVTVNQTGTVASVSGALQQAVSSGFLGQMSVDPNYFIVAQGNGYIRITGITADGNYFEGSTVKFTCSADVIGNVGSIQISWRLNNALINPTAASRWKTEVLADDPQYPGRKQYQLTVNPLHTGDTGALSCHLSDSSLESNWNINVNVIGKPVVTISPLTTIVHQGDSLNIDCKVVNTYPNVLSSIVWYKNGASFLGGQGEVINRVDIATHHILSITNIQNTVGYECMAMNSAGNGPRGGCNVTVIKGGVSYKYCPTITDNFGTRWNSTIDNTKVIIPCTGDFKGTVSRYCNTDGFWEDADYSHCVRVEIDSLQQQSEDLKNGVEVADVNKILQTLTNLTSEKDGDLRSGDLEVTSSTLNNVADHAAQRTDSITDNQLEEFASSCNNLLNENNKEKWEQLKKLNLAGISRLVEAVTTFSKAFTNVNSEEFSKIVQNDNLVVQVGKVKAKDVTFPDRSQTSQPLPTWITDSTTEVKLDKTNLNGQQPTGFSSTYYRNISDLFGQYLVSDGDLKSINGTYDVNSVIVDFSIDPAPATLNPPLVVEFQHLNVNYSRPICGFWDFSVPNTPNGAWSTVGSRTVQSSTGSTICEYDHTTNFALLMSPGITPPVDLLALSIISSVGCGVSILFLLITVVLYFVLWRYLKSDRATILVNLCVALILSYVLFLAGVTQTENQDVCTAIAALLHYIFLVDFHLMLAEGIEVAFCVLYVFSTRSRVHWLVPGSWIVPAIIVAISMGVTGLEGYGNSQFCWLSIDTGLLWAFVGPALLVVLINLIILILVLKTMFSSHSMLTKTAKQQAKVGIRSVCVILPLFGITWVFGVFSVNEDLVVFQYLFAIFNSLQGFFIFLLHCFFNRQVREGIQHSRRRKMSRHVDFSKSTSQTRNSVTKDTDNIHNNLEEELKTVESDTEEESKNPFLQADNQVQEIVSKFLKAGDGKGNNLNKDNPLSIDDIKITNIMREAEINDPPSREADNGTRNSASSIEKKASRSSSDNKSSFSSREATKYKASSSSSRTRTQSTEVDLRHSSRSDDDFELKMKEDQTRIESVYSASFERKSRSKSRPTHYPNKKTIFEQGPSQKKSASHWGKVKQTVESKKQKQKSRDHDRSRDYDRSREHDRSRDHEKSRDKDRRRRGKHRDRSEVYAVDYYDNPIHPPHHRSMEDMNMHYMGYQQPFIRTYEPLRTPHGYHHQDVPWYEVRPDYC